MKKPSNSILVVDDEEAILQPLSRILELEGYYVNTAEDGRVAINMLQTLPFDIVLLDLIMPNVGGIDVLKYIKDQHLDTEVIMLTATIDVKTAVDCMKLGAYYYITKPYLVSDLLTLIGRALERKQLVIQNKGLRRQIALKAMPSSMVGMNKSFLEMMDLALRSAKADSAILIQGATGTGKELIAHFVHSNSLRKDNAFLAVNCASLPEPLLESELFGHEKGAFTDAKTAKQGLVEIADGGTLFLDEIAEMPLTIQPKLLRFLQTGEFRRVGGNKNLRSDVRLISATNRDLRQEAIERRFREDLLFRLNVITLQVPSLRDRQDDIPLLVDHFLKAHAGTQQPKKIDESALDTLKKYHWPGNVRELENVIERAVVFSQDSEIRLDDLALPLGSFSEYDSPPSSVASGIRAGSAVTLTDLTKAHIEGVLGSVGWDKEVAAKILGMRLNTLYEKIRRYHLQKPK